MKKIFFIIIGGYLMIGFVIFLIIDNKPSDMVHMMVVEKDYARVLTEDEVIDVILYISDDKSFFTNKDLISSAHLVSEQDEAEIEIIDIRNGEDRVIYDNITYHKFYISMSLKSLFSQSLELDFINAQLVLQYENDVEMIFDLGQISLLFHQLNQPPHIDFDRLYSIHNDGMTALYISLINKTDETIEITGFNNLVKDMTFDCGGSLLIYQENDRILNIDDYLPNYQRVVDEFEDSQSIYMTHDIDLLIPTQYLGDINYINRFPVIIDYIYHGQAYTYVIDDFLFYDTISDFYEGHLNVNTYSYHYQ